MRVKLQCCRCKQAPAGEQLYRIDGEIYCSICGMDKVMEITNLVKFDGFAGDEAEQEEADK